MGRAVSTLSYTNWLLTQIWDLKDWCQLIGSSALENLRERRTQQQLAVFYIAAKMP